MDVSPTLKKKGERENYLVGGSRKTKRGIPAGYDQHTFIYIKTFKQF